MDDPSGDTKSVDDMVLDEVKNMLRFTSASGITSAYFEK